MARHGNLGGKKIRRYGGSDGGGMAKHAQSGQNGRPRRDRMLEARAKNAAAEDANKRKAARRGPMTSSVAELFARKP